MATRATPSEDIEQIFTKYKDKVYRLAISIVHNDRDAQDILQNTFIKVIENLKYFRHQAKISTWIYKIAYNESLMYLRKKYRQFKMYNRAQNEVKLFPSGMFVNWSKMPDEELQNAELKERLSYSIRHIPVKYRMPLLLHHIEGLSLEQSAQILNMKVNSLKTRLHRSIMMVGSTISDYFKDRELATQNKNPKSCGMQLRFLYAFTKGDLSHNTQKEFSRHVSDCPNCKIFMAGYAKAIAITEALECRDIPLELEEKIKSFLRAHKKYEPFLLPKHQNYEKEERWLKQ